MLFCPGLIVSGPTSKCIFVAPSRSGRAATVVVVLNATVSCGNCVVAGASEDDAVDDDAVDVPAGDVVFADESPCVGATVACVAAADCDFDVLSVPHAAMSNPPTASATAISRRPLICGTVTAPPASNALSGESGSASDSAARAALVSWRPRNVTR